MYVLDPAGVDEPVYKVLHFDKSWIERANSDRQFLIDTLNGIFVYNFVQRHIHIIGRTTYMYQDSVLSPLL